MLLSSPCTKNPLTKSHKSSTENYDNNRQSRRIKMYAKMLSYQQDGVAKITMEFSPLSHLDQFHS
jgi:hypothetical protein